jgi:hypothetical protein
MLMYSQDEKGGTTPPVQARYIPGQVNPIGYGEESCGAALNSFEKGSRI